MPRMVMFSAAEPATTKVTSGHSGAASLTAWPSEPDSGPTMMSTPSRPIRARVFSMADCAVASVPSTKSSIFLPLISPPNSSSAMFTPSTPSWPNVWRTSYAGQQPTYALGQYAADQGYKKVVTIAEDYDFPYAQVGGFMLTYCTEADDTEVARKFWTPIGTSDYSSIITQIPDDADALFVALGGTDMVNFVHQLSEYGQLGELPILGGTVAV